MKKTENKFPFSMYSAVGEGRIINAHTNESSMEIVEVLYGIVSVQLGTEILEASAGDFIYVPPTLVFSADALSEKTSVRRMLFDASILEENMENFDAEVFYMFHLQSKNKATIFKKGHPVYEILAKYMQDSYDDSAFALLLRLKG